MTRPSWQDFATHDESAYPELWDGVVGAWCPSLGPTGLRLHDHSRRNNWGTLTNMDPPTDWVVSDGQYALDFDGTNDYVDCRPIHLAGDFSISVWLKSGNIAQTNRYLLSSNSPPNGNPYALIYGYVSQSVEFFSNAFVGSDPRTGSAITIADAAWYHVAYVYRNGVWAGYRNGKAIFSTARSFALSAPTTNVAIGAFSTGSNVLIGNLDDIKFRTRGLTANEVAAEYELGRGGMYQRRRRTLRRVGVEQPATFKAYRARRQNQIIGGGV